MSLNEYDNNTNSKVYDFVSRLSGEEAMLVTLKKDLYEGDWEAMLTDLKNRLEGKPYIFKLANRIIDDIKRIETLQVFEKEQKIDLADFIRKSV